MTPDADKAAELVILDTLNRDGAYAILWNGSNTTGVKAACVCYRNSTTRVKSCRTVEYSTMLDLEERGVVKVVKDGIKPDGIKVAITPFGRRWLLRLMKEVG